MEIPVYSDDGQYRYLSEERISDSSDRELLIIMLNPATTAETDGDPKRRRHTRNICMKFAKERGFGKLSVANLFAYRAKNPKELLEADDPVGPENDHWIGTVVERADLVIVAWGSHGYLKGRSSEVLERVLAVQTPYHMGKTQRGEPLHPRSWRKVSEPVPWQQ